MTESTSRPDEADFRTFDLTLATFLVGRGCHARINALNEHQAAFVFDRSPELTANLEAYASGSHQIDAVTYQTLRTALRKRCAIACASLRGRPA